jgi:hypothetical protein
MFPKERSRPEVGRVVLWSVVRAENHGFALASMPQAPLSLLFRAFCCFPPASRAFGSGAGMQKTPRMASFNGLFGRVIA